MADEAVITDTQQTTIKQVTKKYDAFFSALHEFINP